MAAPDTDLDDLNLFLDALERFLNYPPGMRRTLWWESCLSSNPQQIDDQLTERWCLQGQDEIDLVIWELLQLEERVSLGEIVASLSAGSA